MSDAPPGMIAHILFPYRFLGPGSQAAPFVHALADQFHARVTVLSVVPPTFEVMPAGLGVRAGEDVADWLRTLKSRLDDALITELAGLPVERITDAGDPGFRITDVAHSHGVDLIMMPTHGLGLFPEFARRVGHLEGVARCEVPGVDVGAHRAPADRRSAQDHLVRRGRPPRERRPAAVGRRLQRACRGRAHAAPCGGSHHGLAVARQRARAPGAGSSSGACDDRVASRPPRACARRCAWRLATSWRRSRNRPVKKMPI